MKNSVEAMKQCRSSNCKNSTLKKKTCSIKNIARSIRNRTEFLQKYKKYVEKSYDAESLKMKNLNHFKYNVVSIEQRGFKEN